MEDWKQRLYNNYISSGHVGVNIDRQRGLNVRDYPYAVKLLKKHLPSERKISIADLACGHGALLFCLKKLGYYNVHGIDTSPEQVNLAHELGVREVECQDIMSFLRNKENQFDVIFLMDILEHLRNSDLFDLLNQVSKALKNDGLAIVHVPNAEGVFGMRVRYGDLTHENCFTPQSIRQALGASGFRNIECLEDKPVIHGIRSLLRYILWELLTLPFRLLLITETGTANHILSQNMTVVAKTHRAERRE